MRFSPCDMLGEKLTLTETPCTLKKFILYQMKKFDEEGNLKRRVGSGGGGKLPREKVEEIKRNIVNKKWPSSRKTASETQVHLGKS